MPELDLAIVTVTAADGRDLLAQPEVGSLTGTLHRHATDGQSQ
jgi:hypothetical protein